MCVCGGGGRGVLSCDVFLCMVRYSGNCVCVFVLELRGGLLVLRNLVYFCALQPTHGTGVLRKTLGLVK